MRVDSTNILEDVQQHNEIELQQIARESGDWERLFHLSDNRANVVQWLEVAPESCALEIGAQAGAISAVIAPKYDRYVALDIAEDMNRAFEARKSCAGIEYVLDNICNYAVGHQGEYDDIYMIGCLADALEYISYGSAANDNLTDSEACTVNDNLTDAQDCAIKLIETAKSMLKPNGRLIIAAENKLGMKYWSGCQEENNGGYYINIENYPNGEARRTFSKKELVSILEKCDMRNLDWYYPYPDLYFAKSIYSDEYLPQPGELLDNINNYNRDRYLFFDEGKAYSSIIKEGLYPEFANSFLVIAHNNVGTHVSVSDNDKTVYVKYSKERDRRFAIRTDIKRRRETANHNEIEALNCDNCYVVKKPCYPQGVEHIEHAYKCFENMFKEYEAAGMSLNNCKLSVDELRFEYVEGENLQTRIDYLIRRGDEQAAEELFDEYINRCFMSLPTVDFVTSEAFEEVYGKVDLGADEAAYLQSDVDMICSNIFIQGDKWQVIDYEWSMDFAVPRNYILYRALYLAHHQIARCEFLELDRLMEKYGISEDKQNFFQSMENHFQEYVRGQSLSDSEVHKRIGKKVFTINELNEVTYENERLANDNENMQKRIEQLLRERSLIKAALGKLRKKL